MKKIILFLFISMFLLTLISAGCPAGDGYLGNKEYNSCIRITQTCLTCSYVNITSITLSVSNKTLVTNVAMTNLTNGEWIYNFCNTTNFGSYFILGKGDIEGTSKPFKSCFDIGQNLSTGESIIYFLFVFILFMFLIALFYLILIMPNDNYKNESGIDVAIIKLKYLRIFLIALCYPVVIIILNLMNGLAIQFATLSIFAGTISFLFQTMLKMAWVFTIIIILWIIYKLVQDSNVKRNIERMGKFRI